MFIEQLTIEQLCEFFKPKCGSLHSHMCVESRTKKEHLYVSIDNNNYRLYDFEGSTVSKENEWRNFLYNIFGEEYKVEYEKYLQAQTTLKLSNLKKKTQKEELLEFVLDERKKVQISEYLINSYYAIKDTFSYEEIMGFSDREVENLVKLANNMSEECF